MLETTSEETAMGYSTDFVGHLMVTPRLNEHEIDYLQAFTASRRFDRGGDPYDVPGNPRAESSADVGIEAYNTSGVGQPGLWCHWAVCWNGDCLTWNGIEKSYRMVEWLRYLIDHFLAPDAHAAGDERFAGFTFDHRVEGTMVGCRRDTRELFVISATDNHVSVQTLAPGDPQPTSYGLLPYEQEVDREREQVRRRRRRGRAERPTADVVPFPRQRG